MDEQKELEKNSAPLEPVTEPVPDIDIPTLRTYKNDISHTVNHDKITSAKILMAEQRRSDIQKEKKEEVSVKKPLNMLALVFGILFLVASVGVVGYFGYTKVVKKTFETVTIPPSFLFVFDSEKYINSNKDREEVFGEVDKAIQESQLLQDETFTDLVFFKVDADKTRNRISSTEFFDIYGVELPTNIARSISKDFVYGTYKTNGKMEPFLVVGLVDFENTYSSMFVWESTLALDIKDAFPVLKNLFDISKGSTILTPVAVASTTATSTVKTATTTPNATSTIGNKTSTTTTPALTPEEEFERDNELRQVINRTIRFVDIVLYNRDVRGVRDQNGNPFFYYTYLDRDKILFAQDPKIVNEINRKIKEKQLVR